MIVDTSFKRTKFDKFNVEANEKKKKKKNQFNVEINKGKNKNSPKRFAAEIIQRAFC